MKKFLPVILIVIITFLTFSGTLSHEFLSWDDKALITENYLVRTFSPSIFWSYDPELYIPVTLLSFQVNHLLFGLNPFWFHLTNLIIHILNALLVFWLSLLILKKRYLALFVALIFALHPINTETVAWISARKELLSTLFLLSSLITYIKANNRKRLIVLSIVLFALAMMSKVTALVLPLILILYDQTQPKTNNQKLKTYIPFFALTIIFAIVAIGGKSQAIEQLTIFQVILLSFRSLTFYLQKFFLPINLSAIYPSPVPLEFFNPEILISFAFVFGLAISIWIFRKKKIAMFASGFAVFTIAPSFLAYTRSDGISVAADRYAYMPSIGLSILITIIFAGILKTSRESKASKEFAGPVAYAVTLWVEAGIIVLALSGLSTQRAQVWENTESLFGDVLAKNPSSHIAKNNIGNLYLDQGELNIARTYFQDALKLKPDYPEALVNMAAYHGRTGNFSEAERNLKEAMELNPEFAPTYFNLGGVHFMRGNYRLANEAYHKALEINPYYVPAMWQLARTHLHMGQRDEAKRIYLTLLELDRSYKGKRPELDELIN